LDRLEFGGGIGRTVAGKQAPETFDAAREDFVICGGNQQVLEPLLLGRHGAEVGLAGRFGLRVWATLHAVTEKLTLLHARYCTSTKSQAEKLSAIAPVASCLVGSPAHARPGGCSSNRWARRTSRHLNSLHTPVICRADMPVVSAVRRAVGLTLHNGGANPKRRGFAPLYLATHRPLL
jgi:hypothetical protein